MSSNIKIIQRLVEIHIFKVEGTPKSKVKLGVSKPNDNFYLA